MATAAEGIAPTGRDRSRDRAAVRVWLYVVAVLIVIMVLIGGATRLTGSGLSITEWQPIHGVVPPLSEADWQDEFARYRQIPEYQLLNQGMTLGEFKGIFWWEWAHRLLGRVIGVVFLLPLVFFIATGRVERRLVPQLAGIFVLGGLQGAVGWWMVASGLSERTDVSQYRLAIHLTLACALLAAVLWVARGLAGRRQEASPGLRRATGLVVGLVFLQIFLGAIVAGLDAGLIANTWPLMDGEFVPAGLLAQSPAWTNLFENAVTAQFDHRLAAYLILAVAVGLAVAARGTPHARRARNLALIVAGQGAIGVAALLYAVPLPLALLHQFGAVGVLSHAVLNLRAMYPDRVVAEADKGAAWTASRPRPT